MFSVSSEAKVGLFVLVGLIILGLYVLPGRETDVRLEEGLHIGGRF